MTMQLARVEQQPQDLMPVAARLANSGLIPRALQKKPDDVLVVLMTGAELGLQPMQSLRSISVIDGKAVCESALLVGLCLRQRDVCEYFRLVEGTDKFATYETRRAGSEPVKLSFTIAEAAAAGLASKDNWRRYPAAMLRARCAAHLARAVYSDLTAGIYTPEEAAEFKGAPGLYVAPEPEKGAKEAAAAKAAEARARIEQRGQSDLETKLKDSIKPTPPIIDMAPGETEAQATERHNREPGEDDGGYGDSLVSEPHDSVTGEVVEPYVPTGMELKFGKHKGLRIDDPGIEAQYLGWLVQKDQEALVDPAKAKYHRSTTERLAAIEAELLRRKASK